MIAREPAREQKAFVVRIFFRMAASVSSASLQAGLTMHLARAAMPGIT
jgi:hypothetical protein